MLPFGSLAPGILLPILAFAYMLYFGACAINAGIKGDEVRLPGPSTEKKLIKTGKSSVSPALTSIFCVNKNAKHDAIRRNIYNFLAQKQSVSQIIKIPEKQFIPDFHRFTLFSRPPPVYI